MLPCKPEGVSAAKLSSSRVWHTLRREQKEGSSPLSSRAQGACGVWAVTQSPCPAGSPGGCTGCRGCSGRHSQRLFPVHPCLAGIGAWDVSQMKTQAASPILPSSQKGCSVTQRGGPAAQAVEQLVCHSSLKGFGTVKETPSTFWLQASGKHLF